MIIGPSSKVDLSVGQLFVQSVHFLKYPARYKSYSHFYILLLAKDYPQAMKNGIRQVH